MVRLVILISSIFIGLMAIATGVFSILGDVNNDQSAITIFWNLTSQMGWGLSYAILGLAIADMVSPLRGCGGAALRALFVIGIIILIFAVGRTAFIMSGMLAPENLNAEPYAYGSFLLSTATSMVANVMAIFFLAAFFARSQKIQSEGSFR